MDLLLPRSVDEAVAALAERPDAVVLAGGTDVMVAVNAGVVELSCVVALRHVTELRDWTVEGDRLRLGAGLTYTDLAAADLGPLVPGLAQAARTVGSPPIRNTGTIGGNLVTASPAGDTLPLLVALDAEVEVAGPDGRRTVALTDLITGPKRTTLAQGELVTAVTVPARASRQDYRKVGVRNAMVIAVASVAVVADAATRRVTCGLGSVGPGPLRAVEAEAWISERVDWDGPRLTDPADAAAFGAMVGETSRPIDDHRSTAAYRRRAVEVLASRGIAATLAA